MVERTFSCEFTLQAAGPYELRQSVEEQAGAEAENRPELRTPESQEQAEATDHEAGDHLLARKERSNERCVPHLCVIGNDSRNLERM